MEKKKPWLIAAAAVASAQLLVQVLTVIFVLRLKMLPTEYVVVLILAMVILFEATTLLMFIPVKDRIRLWRKIVSCVLAAVIMTGCILASCFAWRTYHFVDEISGGTFVASKQIRVVVLKDSPAKTIEDTKGFRYGVIRDYDAEHTQQMISTVEEKTGNSVTFTDFQQVTVMVDALYNKQVDAIILHPLESQQNIIQQMLPGSRITGIGPT